MRELKKLQDMPISTAVPNAQIAVFTFKNNCMFVTNMSVLSNIYFLKISDFSFLINYLAYLCSFYVYSDVDRHFC